MESKITIKVDKCKTNIKCDSIQDDKNQIIQLEKSQNDSQLKRVNQVEELKQYEIISTQNQNLDTTQQHPLLNRSIFIFKQLKSKPVEVIIFSYLPNLKAQLIMRSLSYAGIVQSKNLVNCTQSQGRIDEVVSITIKNKKDFERTQTQFKILNNKIAFDVSLDLCYAPQDQTELSSLMLLFQSQSLKIKEFQIRDIDSSSSQSNIYQNYQCDQKILGLQSFKILVMQLQMDDYILEFFIINQ